ncbi:MAG TPA: VWA domain-containing protein [Candidatus Sulfopaludibacter sp.]|jgi:VWFA-related protein|nr:VWA domain-containing protein [Candidatus Sulfopaludibacter sp.]
MGVRRVAAWAALSGIAAIVALFGQVNITPRAKPEPEAAKLPPSNIRVDSNLVLVPVSVCDPNNRPVTGLEKEHFKILDDKVEQTITHFAMEDEPLAVGLVFDISGSMTNKIRRSRLAASAFFRTANPEDEFFLVEFNDQPRLVVPLTNNYEEIQNQLTFAPSQGRTALLDAIFLALHEIKKSKLQRKALLIVSDGGDNSSRYTEGEVRNRVRESDVLIYALGIFEPEGSRGRSPEEQTGPGLLNDICEQTGGRHIPVNDLAEMPDIAAKIGIELRNRYMIGFTPTDTQRDGRYHHVQVKVIPPHGLPALKASWRLGYYAK